MTEHGSVRPSIPVTRSAQGRTLVRSSRRVCICHVHPLSTMKLMLERPAARRRPRLAICRRWREAINALADVEGGDETAPAGGDAENGGAAAALVSGSRDEAFPSRDSQTHGGSVSVGEGAALGTPRLDGVAVAERGRTSQTRERACK
eukprot:1008317-Pleurochrysis_carterae.AAC.1